LLATAVDGIIAIDPKGLIYIYNQACERLFGYRANEAVGGKVFAANRPSQGLRVSIVLPKSDSENS
jgi:PAS domain S-box-containing protein